MWQQIAKYVYFARCEAQVSLSFRISRKYETDPYSIALGKVQEESDSLETDQKMRNTQNKKYQFVEADLPVIRFQVPLKKDKITARGDQPQESIIFSKMAVTIAT